MNKTIPTIAEVVFNLSANRGFDYTIPSALLGQIEVGSRITADFNHSKRSGYVMNLKKTSVFPTLKPILALESNSRQIPPKLLKLAAWISDYYCCARENAVWSLLPAVVRKGAMEHKKCQYIFVSEKAIHKEDGYEALKETERKVITTLEELGPLTNKNLLGVVDTSAYSIKKLCEKGWLTKEIRVTERDPFIGKIPVRDKPKKLNDEQLNALKVIENSLNSPTGSTILLHGVTCSGKTEVYLQAIQHCLKQKRTAIVLVPEISLTPQTCDRFRQRFGNLVSVLHSGLSDGERFDEWTRIHEGRSQIAIGARSALFAPFTNLGLIVVDEEHEDSYKQNDAPRYNARDVAVVRGRLENATVLLGSATPSLESYLNCQRGRYTLIRMKERIGKLPMPRVEIIDMSAEIAKEGRGTFFSERLKEQMKERLKKAEQIILFLNRRGFATQLMCEKCGYTAQCENCSIGYTYHRKEGKLICHMCGAEKTAPVKCPKCGDPGIRFTGCGTEKIESITRAMFPKAVVARMDSDTMGNKNSYSTILDAFRSGHIDILIGTQMITKGLDFPNVTLVGIIRADTGLNLPDFRSAERTFQLITQVAGRAGRGETPGLVIVQTHMPYHFALQAAQEHSCERFIEEELPTREALDFPPYSHMLIVHFKSEDAAIAEQTATAFSNELCPMLPPDKIQIIGPMPAPLSKVNKYYRFQILLRGGNIRFLTRTVHHLLQQKRWPNKAIIYIDVDPRSLL
ncbi:MAG: primosomal protein N' [Lentisphaeria bacterium]